MPQELRLRCWMKQRGAACLPSESLLWGARGAVGVSGRDGVVSTVFESLPRMVIEVDLFGRSWFQPWVRPGLGDLCVDRIPLGVCWEPLALRAQLLP